MTSDPSINTLATGLWEMANAMPEPSTLLQVIEALPTMVAVMDHERRHLFANGAYRAYMHCEQAELAGRTVADLLGDDVFRAAQTTVERVLKGETVQSEGWLRHPLGGQRYVQRAYLPQRGRDGAIHGYFVLINDITERRQTQDDLFRLAYYDALTGLANRLLLLKHVADYLGESEPFTLVIVEIDRFVEVRTSLGQGFADELLVDLAKRLNRDAGPVELLARVGDHAFALLLGAQPDEAALAQRLEAIAAIVRHARSSSGGAVFLTASIGVAASHAAHERPEDALRDAEIATGRAREGGGARQAWFDPAMHARVVDQVRLEHDLRRALEREEELWVAYQPIVEMVTGGLAGFEALVRWNHPERGLIPPVVFIPIAESTGLVVALGKWVLRTACKQIAQWQDQRMPGSAPLFMSVNLSPRQLSEPDFVQVVRQTLRETGVEPSWLKLEITESAVMEKAEQAIRLLHTLRGFGIKMSIDDFGTGYSSLSYLHRLPIDSLKIDRSFVSAMHNSEENRAIVRIIVDLARLLGFDVIAEGIETIADANLLRALACDYGQGYHFARPMPPHEADSLVGGALPWQNGR